MRSPSKILSKIIEAEVEYRSWGKTAKKYAIDSKERNECNRFRESTRLRKRYWLERGVEWYAKKSRGKTNLIGKIKRRKAIDPNIGFRQRCFHHMPENP